ncbi:hypothetical protein [Acidovorax sp. A1169]|nr:hypothetical protein [Acidovorax sp. A1169]
MHITDSDPLACTRPAQAALQATTAATKLRQHLPAKEACHGQ